MKRKKLSHEDFMVLWEAYIGSDRFHAPKVRYTGQSLVLPKKS